MAIEIGDNELGLDEVAMRDCSFHMERMADDCFWIGVDNREDGLYHISIFIEDGILRARIEKQ